MLHEASGQLPNGTHSSGFMPRPLAQAAAALTLPQPRDPSPVIDALWQRYGKMPMQTFSRRLSKLVGRTVLIVDLADEPHAPTVRSTGNHAETPFTEAQLAERVRFLQDQAKTTFPDKTDIWDKWQWKESAKVCAPNIDELLVKGGAPEVVAQAQKLPARLAGDCWDKAAIIFSPDPRWTPQQDWALLTGMGGLLERSPPGTLVQDYSRKHEFAHLLQRRRNFDKAGESWRNQRKRWVLEYDADNLFLKEARRKNKLLQRKAKDAKLTGAALTDNRAQRQTLIENAQAVKHMRVISGFLYTMPRYWIGLAQDNATALGLSRLSAPPGDDKAAQQLHRAAERAAEKSSVVGYELRWRVAAQLEGKPLQEDSATLQAKIRDWRSHPEASDDRTSHRWELNRLFSDHWTNGKNFAWGGLNDVRQSIPAVREVLASGAITDPLTRRNAQLVSQAAEYFRPSLKVSQPLRPQSPAATPQAHNASL